MRALFVALAALLYVVLIPALALAQDAAPSTTVAVGGLWGTFEPIFLSVVSAIATAFIGWACAALSKKAGIDVEATYRDSLHSAAMTAAKLILAKAGGSLPAATIDVKSPLMAEGLNWVVRSVPDALAYFGIDPKRTDLVEQLVASKLAELLHTQTATANAAATAAAVAATTVAASAPGSA